MSLSATLLAGIAWRRRPIDVVITGRMGLYSIRFETPEAYAFFQKHLSKGPRSFQSHALVCEGSDRCRELVAGMDRDGLRVELNGIDMRGFAGKAAS